MKRESERERQAEDRQTDREFVLEHENILFQGLYPLLSEQCRKKERLILCVHKIDFYLKRVRNKEVKDNKRLDSQKNGNTLKMSVNKSDACRAMYKWCARTDART